MDKISITKECKAIEATQAKLDCSSFNDVSMVGVTIVNADLSDLTIEGAKIGGASLTNIGLPPEGHPAYNPDFKHRPVTFNNCDLNNSTFTNCNLGGVAIKHCNLAGMTIDGVSIEELLLAYNNK